MAACMGVGGLIGAFIAGMAPPGLRWRAQFICGSMLIFGGAIVTMGLARDALTLDLAYGVMGVSFAVPEVLSGALFQRIIPNDMLGRVVSVISLLAMVMNPAGLFLAGWLGDTVGLRAGLWVGGGAIVTLALVALFTPTIRALNRLDAASQLALTEVTALVEGIE
jgi:hypothetical protein